MREQNLDAGIFPIAQGKWAEAGTNQIGMEHQVRDPDLVLPCSQLAWRPWSVTPLFGLILDSYLRMSKREALNQGGAFRL